MRKLAFNARKILCFNATNVLSTPLLVLCQERLANSVVLLRIVASATEKINR